VPVTHSGCDREVTLTRDIPTVGDSSIVGRCPLHGEVWRLHNASAIDLDSLRVQMSLPGIKGYVCDAGGGQITVMVDRDTKEYLPLGVDVTVVPRYHGHIETMPITVTFPEQGEPMKFGGHPYKLWPYTTAPPPADDWVAVPIACPTCGWAEHTIEFHEAGAFSGVKQCPVLAAALRAGLSFAEVIAPMNTPDHLCVTCDRCGYRWAMEARKP